MYNPARQFRCIIIRGKSRVLLDDLLPAYARIIHESTPSPKEKFEKSFNRGIAEWLSEHEKKALDNHRTEISGRLFGLWYEDDDEIIRMGRRGKVLLETNDQPQFFKSLCFRFQQPSGMDAKKGFFDKRNQEIGIRPLVYVLALINEAKKRDITLTKDEIGYYVLNSLEALQGKATIEEVIEQILKDRSKNIRNKVVWPGKASSYNVQHINEQLILLELANLVYEDGRYIFLNSKESKVISHFVSSLDEDIFFPVYDYDLETSFEEMRKDWQKYYCDADQEILRLCATSMTALGPIQEELHPKEYRDTSATGSTNEIGEQGESFVFEYEKKRVSEFDPNLVAKVKNRSNERGIGYDIESVYADASEKRELHKYLEVKATKRVTKPQALFNDQTFEISDSFNMTRNEWIAAEEYGEDYFVYRVYFTREGTYLFVIPNPAEKEQIGNLTKVPLQYSIEFGSNAGYEMQIPRKVTNING